MATVFSLVFRLDFEKSYALMDAPGTCLRKMREASKDFWDDVSENNNRQFVAIHREQNRPTRVVENVTVEYSAISGSYESEQGVEVGDVSDLINFKYFEVADQVTADVMNTFEIRNVKRVGVRLFLTGGPRPKDFKHAKAVRDKFADGLLPEKMKTSVDLKDVSLNLVGELDHNVSFRMVTGPGEKGDIAKFIANIPFTEKELDERPPHIFAADIDLYQENLNFNGTSIRRWFKARDEHFKKMIAIAEHVNS